MREYIVIIKKLNIAQFTTFKEYRLGLLGGKTFLSNDINSVDQLFLYPNLKGDGNINILVLTLV